MSTYFQLLGDKSLSIIHALFRECKSMPFSSSDSHPCPLNLLFSSHQMWRLQVWFFTASPSRSKMIATCVELHGFIGALCIKIGGLSEMGLSTIYHRWMVIWQVPHLTFQKKLSTPWILIRCMYTERKGENYCLQTYLSFHQHLNLSPL